LANISCLQPAAKVSFFRVFVLLEVDWSGAPAGDAGTNLPNRTCGVCEDSM
jgi:hypothetical protein